MVPLRRIRQRRAPRVFLVLGLFLVLGGIMVDDSSAMKATPWAGHSALQNSERTSAIPIPQEPEEFDPREVEAYYDWRNDMFFRLFDTTGSGTVNFMTARRTYKVWLDDFGTPVVVTVAEPLFYWVDLNGNGEFEQDHGEMWSDPLEDGMTGNEHPYDNSDLQTPPSHIPTWVAPDAKP